MTGAMVITSTAGSYYCFEHNRRPALTYTGLNIDDADSTNQVLCTHCVLFNGKGHSGIYICYRAESGLVQHVMTGLRGNITASHSSEMAYGRSKRASKCDIK